MKGSFPRESDAYPYTGVTVLMLRWEEDDLDVEEEITQLDAVFTRRFGFDTEVWCIPSSPNPTRALQSKLYAFQEAHQSEKVTRSFFLQEGLTRSWINFGTDNSDPGVIDCLLRRARRS